MSSKLTIAAAVALLLGVGAWSALRPGAADSEAPAAATARLAGLPLTIGDWTGSDSEVNLKAMRVAEAEAHLSRTYRNRSEAYTVMILYGSPGGLGAHDPKTCYAGTGFEQRGSSVKVPLADGGGELWNARFERTAPNRVTLDVYWGWGTNGTWHAPEQPRLTFAGEGRIYKIYLQRVVAANSGAELKPAGEFQEPFLHEVKQALAKPNG